MLIKNKIVPQFSRSRYCFAIEKKNFFKVLQSKAIPYFLERSYFVLVYEATTYL